jgi:hypothetical protein
MAPLDRRTFNRSLLAVPAAALAGTSLGALTPAASSAAPADWDAQYLVSAINEEEGGVQLMHRTRDGVDGSWGPAWETVPNAGGAARRVACVGMSNGLNVVAALEGTLGHAIRSADGTWTEFTPIPSEAGPTGVVSHVAVSTRAHALHVFSASDGGNTLYHTVRDKDGNWSPRWTALRTFAGIKQIASTRVDSGIATAVVTGEHKFRYAMQASDGTWGAWGSTGSAAGTIPNGFYRVALVGTGGSLQIFAQNLTSEIFRAIRREDGSWREFKKASVFNNYSPVAICAANVGGEVQLGILDFPPGGPQVVRYSILRDGSWQPVRTVPSVGLPGGPAASIAVSGTQRTA